MHNIPGSASIHTYILDLTYTSAILQAATIPDLAGEVQARVALLKHQRAEYERAEELEVVAYAMIAAKDLQLDQSVIAGAAHVKAAHPDLFATIFPEAPSKITREAYDTEMQTVRTVIAQLETLPPADAVRVEFVPRLRDHIQSLSDAIAQKDDVLSQFAVVRSATERAKADANTLRTQIYARLLDRLTDKKLANAFFRAPPRASETEKTGGASPAAPAAAPGTHG